MTPKNKRRFAKSKANEMNSFKFLLYIADHDGGCPLIQPKCEQCCIHKRNPKPHCSPLVSKDIALEIIDELYSLEYFEYRLKKLKC
ncbi:MAG TPA: hypothetical protein P5136_01545 [Methanofastidiosum sp.]|nr:hypothetical protein [Methanofastidiosum sp.]